MNITEIARIAHEVNRAYCASMGDHSHEPWEHAEAWQQESAVDGVQFRLDNPDCMPEDSHKNWLKLKEKEGWRWGAVKSESVKLHPCILPYEELPQWERSKDYIFGAVVDQLLTHLGDEDKIDEDYSFTGDDPRESTEPLTDELPKQEKVSA